MQNTSSSLRLQYQDAFVDNFGDYFQIRNKKIRNIFIGIQYFPLDASPRTYIPKEAGFYKTFLLFF